MDAFSADSVNAVLQVIHPEVVVHQLTHSPVSGIPLSAIRITD